MKLNAITIANRNTGSTRIRMRLFDFMPSTIDFTMEKSNKLDCDVLYFQKVAWAKSVVLAKKAVAEGIAVVYDLDDNFGVWPGMREKDMCRAATIVTVDTEERAAMVRPVTDRPIVVVPTAIDYMDERPPLPEAVGDGSIVTFGNDVSLRAAKPFFASLDAPRYQVGKNIVIPNATFTSWGLDTFVDTIRQYDMCFVAHTPGSRKSPNRMIAAAAAGVPVIATSTASFSRVLMGLGLEKLLVHSPKDIRRAYDELRADRAAIAKRMQDYAWETYHPTKASWVMYDVLTKAMEQVSE